MGRAFIVLCMVTIFGVPPLVFAVTLDELFERERPERTKPERAKFEKAIDDCVKEVRKEDPYSDFDAFFQVDAVRQVDTVRVFGTSRDRFQFSKCMNKRGFPLS